MEESEILYIALVLEEDSVQKLMQFAERNMPFETVKMFCHHMTIAFNNGNIDNDIVMWASEHDGDEFRITARQYGYSSNAFAVQVDNGEIPCSNKTPHITLAVNVETNGKPVDSNYITDWKSLDTPIELKGFIKTFYRKPKRIE